MNNAICILIIGLAVMSLALIVNQILGVYEGELLPPLVWHMLWIGALLSGIGTTLILLNRKNKTEKNRED